LTTVAEALRRATDRFASNGFDSPRLEARLLLEKAVSQSAVWIYQNPKVTLVDETTERFSSLVERRAAGEPLPYILGEVEFCSRSFLVDDRVLVPRPETEELVELALAYASRRHADGNPVRTIVDVGTGSGVIGISLALELGDVRVIAVDRSAEALQVARMNGERLGVGTRIILVQGDLLAGLDVKADLIVANLPYVPSAQIDSLQVEVRREPRFALDGGPDGLRLYARLLQQVQSHLAAPGRFIGEIGADQGDPAHRMASAAMPGDTCCVVADASRRERFVVVERGAPDAVVTLAGWYARELA
jgi:release factor glutamine methyltransferase